MSTIFTRIINRELPGSIVWEDEQAVAFLSINPLNPGHTLVVPRQEVDHWIELDPALAQHLMQVSQTIAQAQMHGFQPKRIGLIIAGFEVPHTHLHVVPINSEPELNFSNAAPNADPDELARNAEIIREQLREMGCDSVAE